MLINLKNPDLVQNIKNQHFWEEVGGGGGGGGGGLDLIGQV